jgi:outer membrane lipoprotein-sorting protein
VVPVDQRLLPAKAATRTELLHTLQDRSDQIRTLQATVALDASGGAMKTGVLTEYRQTKGFVLVDRPDHIRVKAQAPLALATVFDMVSDGKQYRVSIPIKNTFIMGDTNTPGRAKNPVLNLRPQHIVRALFVDVRPYMNNQQTRSIVEEATEGRRSFYVMSFVNISGEDADLIEKIWIDRLDLQIVRKQIFARDGKVDTDVEYSAYALQGTVPFPQTVVIRRPNDDYMLKMTFQTTMLNEKLADGAFTLERPAGSELVQLEEDTTGAVTNK